jgi:hypothetical protein
LPRPKELRQTSELLWLDELLPSATPRLLYRLQNPQLGAPIPRLWLRHFAVVFSKELEDLVCLHVGWVQDGQRVGWQPNSEAPRESAAEAFPMQEFLPSSPCSREISLINKHCFALRQLNCKNYKLKEFLFHLNISVLPSKVRRRRLPQGNRVLPGHLLPRKLLPLERKRLRLPLRAAVLRVEHLWTLEHRADLLRKFPLRRMSSFTLGTSQKDLSILTVPIPWELLVLPVTLRKELPISPSCPPSALLHPPHLPLPYPHPFLDILLLLVQVVLADITHLKKTWTWQAP